MSKPMTEADYEIMRRFVRRVSAPEGFISRYVYDALKQELTPRQQELVYLYYLEQMRMCDAAKILGITTQSASKTLQRARRKLSRYLKYTWAIWNEDTELC